GGDTSPLISRGKPVYCDYDDGPKGPQAVVNGHYGAWSYWHVSQRVLPSWCALRLEPGPKRVLLTWSSDYTFDYLDAVGPYPQDYSISVSSDSTNGSDGTWQIAITVGGNHSRIREHLLDFSGQSWVKMTVTGVQPRSAQQDVSIDQINVYDVSS